MNVGEMTIDELRALLREVVREVVTEMQSDVETDSRPHQPLNLPVDDLGPWPTNLSLRREEMYGDDGR